MDAESLFLFIGKRFRQIRLEQKIPVVTLARQMKCSVHNIYAIERGTYPPSLRSLAQWQELLGAEAFDFFIWPDREISRRHRIAELTRGLPPMLLEEIEKYIEERVTRWAKSRK